MPAHDLSHISHEALKRDPVTAGIDIGSSTAQAVILRNKEILGYSNVVAGVDRTLTANRVLDLAAQAAGLSRNDIDYTVGTGYGRYLIPFADKNVTEITCHAKGASYFFSEARTVLDMGGQDCKVISCDQGGRVRDFAMNDKCAAGTGRAMEVISRLLGIALTEIGPLSLAIHEDPPRMSSGCVVFAKSEALRMLRRGISLNLVLAAYCEASVERVLGLIQRVGLNEALVISGGIAKNTGVVGRIESRLGIKANICFEPQIVGAVGAALIGQENINL
jgi:benzoyl-CoA reductase subunit A